MIQSFITGMAGIKMAGLKAMLPVFGGGFLAIGAMLAQVNGQINESTGVAIGFVSGIVCTVAPLAWFFRGVLDDLRAEVRRVEAKHEAEINRLKDIIERLKKKVQID